MAASASHHVTAHMDAGGALSMRIHALYPASRRYWSKNDVVSDELLTNVEHRPRRAARSNARTTRAFARASVAPDVAKAMAYASFAASSALEDGNAPTHKIASNQRTRIVRRC